MQQNSVPPDIPSSLQLIPTIPSNDQELQENGNLPKLDLVSWIQQNEELTITLYFSLDTSLLLDEKNYDMVCRICEQTINALVVQEHSDLCSQKTEQTQSLLNINTPIKNLLEKTQKKELDYQTKLSLSIQHQKKLSNTYMSPVQSSETPKVGQIKEQLRSKFWKRDFLLQSSDIGTIEESKNSESPKAADEYLQDTIISRNASNDKDDNSSTQQKPIQRAFLKKSRTLVLSGQYGFGQTLGEREESDYDFISSNEMRDDQSEQELVNLQMISFDRSNNFLNIQYHTPSNRREFVCGSQKNLTRSYEPSYSPDLHGNTKLMKNALCGLRLIINYCDRLLKQESVHNLENDVRTQSQLKISLLETTKFIDISDLTRECLRLIEQRVDTQKRVKKLITQIEQLNIREHAGIQQIQKIKHQFQKGLSSSFKERSSSYQPKSLHKFRVMDRLDSRMKSQIKTNLQIEEIIMESNSGIEMESPDGKEELTPLQSSSEKNNNQSAEKESQHTPYAEQQALIFDEKNATESYFFSDTKLGKKNLELEDLTSSDIDSKDGSLNLQDQFQVTKNENKINSLDKLQSFEKEEEDSSTNLIQRGYYSDSDVCSKKSQRSSKSINIGLKDFEFLEVLGVGAFGAVWKVKKIKTNDVYALKVIDTKSKTNKNFFESLQNEKNVLEVIEGDFVVKAYYSFSFQDCLFFVLEYINGGDFGKFLLQVEFIKIFSLKGVWGSRRAQLLLAIETLHKKNIIHRDLKPENILLDHLGHVKLADFGLSELGLSQKIKNNNNEETQALILQQNLVKNIKQISKRCESPQKQFSLKQRWTLEETCSPDTPNKINYHQLQKLHISPKMSQMPVKNKVIGTPDYMAPEVIKGESVSNSSLDWWSFGVLVYEFIVGIPPFNDESPEQIFQNILQRKITWPDIGYEEDQISPEAYDLINKLLVIDHNQRLGENGADEIKKHPFFKNVNWKEIRSLEAPVQPQEQVSRSFETGSPMSKKKQNEREKLLILLDKSGQIDQNEKLQKLGVKKRLILGGQSYEIRLISLNEQNKGRRDYIKKSKVRRLK